MKNTKNWWEYEISKSIMNADFVKEYNSKYGDYDYSKDARAYDDSFNILFSQILIHYNNSKKIIITGANSGIEIEVIKSVIPNAKIYALDISSDALGKLSRSYPDVVAIHGNLEDLSIFSDNYFDLYISCRAIHSSNVNLKRALTEAIRVSKNIFISIANGYLTESGVQKGLYDYREKDFNTSLPYEISSDVKNILQNNNFKNIYQDECTSEVIIYTQEKTRT
jgi:phospholipid N-methyltransferase